MVTAFSGRVVSSVACSCSTTALSVVVVTSLVVVTSAALTAENAAALVIIAIARAAVRFFIVWSPCSNAAPTQTKLDQFTAIRKKQKYQRRWYVLPLPARRAALPSKGIGPDRSGQRGHAAGEQKERCNDHWNHHPHHPDHHPAWRLQRDRRRPFVWHRLLWRRRPRPGDHHSADPHPDWQALRPPGAAPSPAGHLPPPPGC